MLRKILISTFVTQSLIVSAAITNDKSLLFEATPTSKIIKSPTAEAINKAEKILSNGSELKTIPRTAILDANASQLIRAAMEIESGKSSKYLDASIPAASISPNPNPAAEKPGTKYFDVLEKSFSSIENDSWADSAANITEVVNYFQNERNLHGKDNAVLDDYYDLAVAFANYVAAGTELDESEQPNFEEACKLMQTARNSALKIQGRLGSSAEASGISAIINDFSKNLDTEIRYIQDIAKTSP